MMPLSGVVVVLMAVLAVGHCIKLQERFAWQELQFDWPDEATKQEAIASGSYKADHNLPLGMDVWNDKLFITVPR